MGDSSGNQVPHDGTWWDLELLKWKEVLSVGLEPHVTQLDWPFHRHVTEF
jgi:hypothetical protein